MIAAALAQPARSADVPATPQTEREVIPGADRMTGAEREAYRLRMQAAPTPEEKAKIRAEYAKTVPVAGPTPLRGDPAKGSNHVSIWAGIYDAIRGARARLLP